jgi:hypothetical protein
MDPINVINQEFVRELRREWTSEATQLACRATKGGHPGLADRLCAALGERLISTGIRLKAHTTLVPGNQR